MSRLKLDLLKDCRFDWQDALLTLPCNQGAAIIA
jgi:hypothetical protein